MARKGIRDAAAEYIRSKGGRVLKQELVDYLRAKFGYKYLQKPLDEVVDDLINSPLNRQVGLTLDGDYITAGSPASAQTPKAPAKK
jgi:hypothetical protein